MNQVRAFIFFVTIILFQTLAVSASLADGAEVKIALSTKNIARSMKALRYHRDNVKVRKIYFIDSKKLSLYQQNILLRLRVGDNENSDVSIKQRPANPKFDWSDFEVEDGFKCEADINGPKKVTSCSLSEDISGDKVEKIFRQNSPLKSFFSETQKSLLQALNVNFVWENLNLLGPITSVSWKIKYQDIKVSVELWKLSSGESFLEISSQGDLNEVSGMKETLKDLVNKLDLSEDMQSISKTEFALKKLSGN